MNPPSPPLLLAPLLRVDDTETPEATEQQRGERIRKQKPPGEKGEKVYRTWVSAKILHTSPHHRSALVRSHRPPEAPKRNLANYAKLPG